MMEDRQRRTKEPNGKGTTTSLLHLTPPTQTFIPLTLCFHPPRFFVTYLFEYTPLYASVTTLSARRVDYENVRILRTVLGAQHPRHEPERGCLGQTTPERQRAASVDDFKTPRAPRTTPFPAAPHQGRARSRPTLRGGNPFYESVGTGLTPNLAKRMAAPGDVATRRG